MNSLIRCWVSGRVPLHEPFPTSVVEHIFLPFVFGDPVFLNLRQFPRLFRLFLRGQVTRRRFTLIEAPRRICFCSKFLLLLQCFSNPRFLPFLSDPTPFPFICAAYTCMCHPCLYVSRLADSDKSPELCSAAASMNGLRSLSSGPNLCLLPRAGKGVLIQTSFWTFDQRMIQGSTVLLMLRKDLVPRSHYHGCIDAPPGHCSPY